MALSALLSVGCGTSKTDPAPSGQSASDVAAVLLHRFQSPADSRRVSATGLPEPYRRELAAAHRAGAIDRYNVWESGAQPGRVLSSLAADAPPGTHQLGAGELGQGKQITARWVELAAPASVGYPAVMDVRVETVRPGVVFARVDVVVTPPLRRPAYSLVPAGTPRVQVRLVRGREVRTIDVDDRGAARELAAVVNGLTTVPPPKNASSCPQFVYRIYVLLDFENAAGKSLAQLRINLHDCPPPAIALLVPGRPPLGFEHARQLLRRVEQVLESHHVHLPALE